MTATTLDNKDIMFDMTYDHKFELQVNPANLYRDTVLKLRELTHGFNPFDPTAPCAWMSLHQDMLALSRALPDRALIVKTIYWRHKSDTIVSTYCKGSRVSVNTEPVCNSKTDSAY